MCCSEPGCGPDHDQGMEETHNTQQHIKVYPEVDADEFGAERLKKNEGSFK